MRTPQSSRLAALALSCGRQVGATVDRIRWGSALAVAGSLLAAACARGADRVYWTNFAGDSISDEDLAGGSGGGVATGTATVEDPDGLAFDPAAGTIFWASALPGSNKKRRR
jgi:hypothetical protein